jgi:hypothetical protein
MTSYGTLYVVDKDSASKRQRASVRRQQCTKAEHPKAFLGRHKKSQYAHCGGDGVLNDGACY